MHIVTTVIVCTVAKKLAHILENKSTKFGIIDAIHQTLEIVFWNIQTARTELKVRHAGKNF